MSAFLCSDQTFTAVAGYFVRKYGDLARVRYTVGRFGEAADKAYPAKDGSMFLPPKLCGGWPDFEKYATREECAHVLASILRAENMRSLVARYAGAPYTRADAPAADTFGDRAAFSPGAIFKLCHCIAYQSCESRDWETTVAHDILTTIGNTAARHTEGYDITPWGL